MKIKLTSKTIKTLSKRIAEDFRYYPYTDIVSLTDNVLFPTFKKVVYETGNTRTLTIDDFYDTMDKYKYLKETYQTLAFYKNMLMNNTSRIERYITICNDFIRG